MTPGEWSDLAEDIYLVIRRSDGLVYEHEYSDGAVIYFIQPRKVVDVTRIRWPKRRERPTVEAVH